MEIYEQIYIQKLETSTVKDRYLLIYNGLYYEASAPVVELLLCLQEEKNMDEAITSYIKKKNRIFFIYRNRRNKCPRPCFALSKRLYTGSGRTSVHVR
mgnify:CR=1 FL=1